MSAAIAMGLVAAVGVARADDATAKAREHYQAGSRQYALGHFDEAVKEYEAAYELRDDPVFLYNIAQAHRLNRNLEKALFFYKSYLSHAPAARNAGEVQKRIVELQALIEAQGRTQAAPPQQPIAPESKPPVPVVTPPETGAASPAAPTTTTPPSDARRGRTRVIAGAALIGGGVALLASGIALSVVAVQAGESIGDAARTGGTFDPSAQDRAKTLQVVGPVLDGVGAAVAIGGAVLLVLGRRDARKVSLAPVGGRGYAGLTWRRDF